MFVGKNIHFSAVDHKPLCSFSAKLCRQRRLNGYAFCVRHVLEDPTAPFKACAYITKYSRNNCCNPVPKHEERQYCNNHLQVLSGANKKEKKPKAQPQQLQQQVPHVNNVQHQGAPAAPSTTKDHHTPVTSHSPPSGINSTTTAPNMLDNRMTLQDRLKTKFNLCQKENGPEEDDLDDPYAFPDSEPLVKTGQSPVQSGPPPPPAPVLDFSPIVNHVSMNSVVACSLPLQIPSVTNTTTTTNVMASSAGSVGERVGSSSSKASTPEDSNHGSAALFSSQGAVPIAKLYPELAEKLERARVKPEVKLKQDSKSRSATRSSRTMNQLQTKIAQNKIKDKLKKNQGQSGSNQTTPEHQPSTPQPQLSPLPAGCGSGTSNSSTNPTNIVSALQTALTPDPAVSPKLPFPCSTLNVNVKNALSNMLKSDSAAITSIPIGLPRHLLHHTPAPPPTAAQTVSAQLQQQQQQLHQQQLQQMQQQQLQQQQLQQQQLQQQQLQQQQLQQQQLQQQQLHLQLTLSQQSQSSGCSSGHSSPVAAALQTSPNAGMVTSSVHGSQVQHLSPARAATPPKVSTSETPIAVASMVSPRRDIIDHQSRELSMVSTLTSTLSMSGLLPQHHQPSASSLPLTTMPPELSSAGVLPPPYPHAMPQGACTSPVKQESQRKSQFIQQLQQQHMQQQFQQPYMSVAEPVTGGQVLSPMSLGGPIPSRPPPAYPHPPPTHPLSVSVQSLAGQPPPPQPTLTTTVTTPTATTTTTSTATTVTTVLPQDAPVVTLAQSVTSVTCINTDTKPTPTASPMPNCMMRPKRPRNLLTGREAKKRLKRHSSVKVYAYHASQRMQNMDLLPFSVDDASDDSDYDEELPWQKDWYVPSSDEDDEDDDDVGPNFARTARLALLRARLRRQFSQLNQAHKVNNSHRCFQQKALQSLLVAARHSAESTSNTVLEIRREPNRHKRGAQMQLPSEQCSFSGDENEEACSGVALPFTNHCVEHIMQSADQQLFDHCTAKFSDNSQCSVPVFDIRHELPLCPEHAAKADNYNKNPEPRPKKPRKKTKPSALTRPPKKGKKKKNQRRNVRPQKPMPPLEPTGNTAMFDEMSDSRSPPKTPSRCQKPPEPVLLKKPVISSIPTLTTTTSTAPTACTSPSSVPTPAKMAGADVGGPTIHLEVTKDLRDLKDITHDLDKMDVLEAALSPGAIAKNLDLPIDSEQATNFLDEHDLHDVLNRLPEEAFDIFSGQGLSELNKNGEFLPSKEEAEELERALAEASQDVDSFKQSLKQLSQAGPMMLNETDNDDDIAKQIADQILQQNLSPSHLDDDLNQDNINDLANSISASDLSTFSQAFSNQNMIVTNDMNNHHTVASNPALANPAVVSQLQRAPQTTLQALQILRGQTHLQGQSHGQVPQPVLQAAQLAHGQLPPGLQITGLPAGLTAFTIGPQGTLIPTMSSVTGPQQRALLAEHLQNVQNIHQHSTFSRSADGSDSAPPRYNNVTALGVTSSMAPNITITQAASQTLAGQPLTVPLTTTGSTVQWGHVGTLPNQNQSIRFPNRFPVLQQQEQHTAQRQQHTQQGLAASLASQGMKLAFPLQSFPLTDLNAMIAASSGSGGSDEGGIGGTTTQDLSLSLAGPGLTAATTQPFNLATATTVVSSTKRQPPAST